MEPAAISSPKDFAENTVFYINQEFAIVKNGKSQRRGKVSTDMVSLWVISNLTFLLPAQSHWATAVEHGTLAAGGQSVHCAAAHPAHSRSHHQDNEGAQADEQRSAAGE